MSLEEMTLDYWRSSQHLQALPTPADREVFILHMLIPRRDNSTDPHEVRLLSRLIDRATLAA